jgi:hypothetical protein
LSLPHHVGIGISVGNSLNYALNILSNRPQDLIELKPIIVILIQHITENYLSSHVAATSIGQINDTDLIDVYFNHITSMDIISLANKVDTDWKCEIEHLIANITDKNIAVKYYDIYMLIYMAIISLTVIY